MMDDKNTTDKNALVESHSRKVAGNTLSMDVPHPMTLVFAHAPFLSDTETTVMVLPYPGAQTCGVIPLSGGQGGLGIIIEQPYIPVDRQNVQRLLDAGVTSNEVANVVASIHFDRVAKTLARLFFNAADNIDPTFHIRAKFEDDALQVERVRVLMAGTPNHHPFWNPT